MHVRLPSLDLTERHLTIDVRVNDGIRRRVIRKLPQKRHWQLFIIINNNNE